MDETNAFFEYIGNNERKEVKRKRKRKRKGKEVFEISAMFTFSKVGKTKLNQPH